MQKSKRKGAEAMMGENKIGDGETDPGIIRGVR